MSFLYKVDVPCAVSSLAFSEDGALFVGGEDGTVRLYSQSSTKVARAITSLGEEISSICCSRSKGRQPGQWYFASGTRIVRFDQTPEKMILTPKDATGAFSIGEDDEDVLNQINLSYDGNYLAFSTDNGAAGVVELSTGQVSRMNTHHTSICGSINFIPDRPSELVSGGYDCKLLHHDFQQRTLLSDLDVAQASASGASDEPGLQLSPPFVLSTAITSTGMFAAGTANGMLFIGTGGEKCPDGHVKKKRRRKWEGLVDTEGTWIKVAEGPVVATAFFDPHQVVTCTLLGEVKHIFIEHQDAQNESSPTVSCSVRWTSRTENITKINALIITGDKMAVGGLTRDGKGVVELWDMGAEAIARRIATEHTS